MNYFKMDLENYKIFLKNASRDELNHERYELQKFDELTKNIYENYCDYVTKIINKSKELTTNENAKDNLHYIIKKVFDLSKYEFRHKNKYLNCVKSDRKKIDQWTVKENLEEIVRLTEYFSNQNNESWFDKLMCLSILNTKTAAVFMYKNFNEILLDEFDYSKFDDAPTMFFGGEENGIINYYKIYELFTERIINNPDFINISNE